jgi:hypothetical protein
LQHRQDRIGAGIALRDVGREGEGVGREAGRRAPEAEAQPADVDGVARDELRRELLADLEPADVDGRAVNQEGADVTVDRPDE